MAEEGLVVRVVLVAISLVNLPWFHDGDLVTPEQGRDCVKARGLPTPPLHHVGM